MTNPARQPQIQIENSFNQAAQALIDQFVQTSPIHANSLIVTVYGDTVCPYGGSIWLGSLIKLVKPLGVNERLVRTCVFRLSEKNLLRSQQIGRRSFYSLTEKGLRQFSSAASRIYAPDLASWDGQWRLVITLLGELSIEQREQLRKELFWLGFTHITTGIFAHPTADLAEVSALIKELQIEEHVAILQATTPEPENVPVANRLIRNCFNTAALDEEYTEFNQQFAPVLDAALNTRQPDPELCFLIKILLIHKYRRILLREPELPKELVEADSASQQARRITAQLYGAIAAFADEYFKQVSESEKGAFAQPPRAYYRRFKN
ncbi:PaaX family transcriptional regulator C-terminal domain-containing protein [uncultured Thiothrix sp.]|uniref:PaaX family transcriptional regulator n=1 Tax=uncultured Thiothrix sp. TaxID=223185 RepID=UPI00260F57AF|nr:PaaX family transcriptional regulator C-terminal domain-containing protein [uncultured Thiothrix sp.]HMT92490.1 PaaX family transcriptional regulator C-terminal domain-containing protein [Thiolinea sp.]